MTKQDQYRRFELGERYPQAVSAQYFSNLGLSKSQLSQDLFALAELAFKREGYFVEFGATDGVSLSNTYLLETHFDWTGILAEPARAWHEALLKNRSALIETDCVWKTSGESLLFNEVETGEFSTLSQFNDHDFHGQTRQHGTSYEVNTVSLNDLLQKHGAPREIDYLSIDTEGSEFEILNAVDFEQYSFKFITCEHNYTPIRDSIYELLTSHGYQRKFVEYSLWDDWYVL